MLHYGCIVSALKIIMYNNIVRFCSETQEMYKKLNAIYFWYENESKVISEDIFGICMTWVILDNLSFT